MTPLQKLSHMIVLAHAAGHNVVQVGFPVRELRMGIFSLPTNKFACYLMGYPCIDTANIAVLYI